MFINPTNKFALITSQSEVKSDLIDINHLIVALPDSALIFFKDKNFTYQGCNEQFINLMGFKSYEQVMGKRVNQIQLSKETTIECERADQRVIESLSTIEINFPIYFESDRPTFELNSKVFPVVDCLEKVVGIFGISTHHKLFPEDAHSFFEMIAKEKINQLVKNKDYIITLRGCEINLTKREVIYLLYLMKGRFAKEIAIEMNICTRTTEDYMQNLKIKMGCYSKSDLILLAFESDLLKILQRSLSDQPKMNSII